MHAHADVLIDVGKAMVAFGTALQQAGTRLQTNPQVSRNLSPNTPTTPETAVTNPSGLPAEGYVRIWNIIGRKASSGRAAIPGLIPVSKSSWYAGVKSGRFPTPIKHGGVSMWRVEQIRALVAKLGC